MRRSAMAAPGDARKNNATRYAQFAKTSACRAMRVIHEKRERKEDNEKKKESAIYMRAFATRRCDAC